APNVNLGADVSVCTNYTYTLTGPQNENYTYKWYVNNQLIANNTFEYSFKVTQAVTVRLEVKVGNCTTSDQIMITPLAVPGITLTANDYEVCVGDAIVLTYATTGATGTFWWDNVTGINPRTVVPQVGNVTNVFWVQAVNTLGCTSRDSVDVKVNALPEVVLNVQGGSNNICINTMAVVNGPIVAGYQYQWYKDGVVSGTNSSTFSFPMQANAQVSLRVTNSKGCTAESLPLTLQVINLPGIILNQDKNEICLGESVTLTIDQQNISSYIWQDGLGGNLPSRTFIPASTATFSFSVSGVHNTTSCVSRDTAFVTVRPAPVALINNPAQTVVCEGQTVTLTTSVLANHQYKWMVAGDSLASGATNLGADVSVCTNYTYTLTGPQNENYTYKWYVNNQLIANNTFEYSFIVTQVVTIRLEVKLGNCTTTDQIVITPLAVPVINVTANNAAICFGDPVVLSLSTQNASSYVWWDGFTGLTTRTIVPVENDTTLAYWAEAINSLGCKSRDTVLVRVNPLPSVPLTVAGGSNIVCYNAVATVQGPQVAGHQYEWFIDDVATGTNTYQLSFTVTKDVTVKLHLTDANGCENTNQIAIQSRNLPGILLSPDSLDVCIGDSYTLVINNQNVNSYSWFDGLAGNLLQRTFEATTTGSFIYWVEGMNNFGCISRDTAFITVNALPDIFIFAPGGTTVCQGEEITLVGSGQEDDLYEWFVNDLLVNNTSTYTFVAGQTTDVSLIVTNVAGCQQTDVITINVLDAPEVDLGADLQVCEGYVLTYTGPLDADHNYSWFVNNTLVSTDSSYTFVLTGNINLRLDVTSPDGCSASDAVAITTLTSPTINVTPDNTEFCLGETATLSLTTNGSSYIWWDGLGTNVPTRSFTPSVGDSTYAYWAKAVSLNGCTSSDTAYVKVNNHPVIDITIQGLANTFCFGSQATIVGPSVEGYTYQWFVNGLAAGENVDRLIFTVTSESLVKLEVTDANGCFGADSLTVFMHTAPGILLSPDSLDICIGESFTLTINPVNVLSYAWWDGLAGNQPNRTITPTVPDMTYIYWAQGINSIGCISFDTAYITVHSLPAAVLLTPLGTSICQGETMILQTPVEEGYTYEWIVDGETLSTEAQLEFVAETSVSVTLIVTNEFNCSTSETVEIEVFITPVIAFGADIFACLNEKVIVAGPIGTGFTYEWLLNGVNTGVTSPTFEYEVVDTVSIVLNMNTTNGCVATDTIVITPLLTPKVTIDASADAFCLGESVTLTASVVDAVAFEWWDGFTNPVRIITPETSGITHYWAEVTSAANCVSRDSISLVVHPNPEIQLVIFEGTPEVCEGGSIMFAVSDNAGIEIDYVVWDNDVTVPMGDEPVLYFEKVFNESSWFFAEMVSVNGCSVSDSIFVTVEPLPEMTISNDTTVCSGETVILESTGGILCIWSDETGMVGAGYTLEIQATETKKYYATIIGDGNLGCSQTDSVTVTVYPLPEVMVQASQQNVCGGTPIVLVASGADSYVWSTGQTGTVITVYPLQTTTYFVTGINESGCSQVALVTVNIIPTPVVTLVGLEEFYCTTAEPAVLTGTPAGGIYSGGIGVIAGKFYPSIAGQGIHQVVYSYVNSFGCTGSDTLQTTVVGITEAINLGENAIICPHEEVVFDAGPGYQKYFWSTGDTTRTTTINGNTYFAGTTRTITVIATIQECSVMGSVELTIRNDCYIGIDEIETKEDMVLIPNPSRGEFIIQHKGGEGELQVSIFDGRSGNVYAGTFETCSEDGRQCKVDLSHLPKGVYMVSIIRGDRRFVRKMVIM
ncbi:MAG: cell wall surface anchor family protein, partial [Bacteroidetes bacterium]